MPSSKAIEHANPMMAIQPLEMVTKDQLSPPRLTVAFKTLRRKPSGWECKKRAVWLAGDCTAKRRTSPSPGMGARPRNIGVAGRAAESGLLRGPYVLQAELKKVQDLTLPITP